jgi:hypothetical protein
MRVVLNWRAFATLLINMTNSSGGRSPHNIAWRACRPPNPSDDSPRHRQADAEPAGNDSAFIEANTARLENLHGFVGDSLECLVVSGCMKDSHSQVASIQDVIQSARFVGSWRSRHELSCSARQSESKMVQVANTGLHCRNENENRHNSDEAVPQTNRASSRKHPRMFALKT